MGSFIKKMKKQEKYSFISVEDLKKMETRALLLAQEMKAIDIVSNSDDYKVRLKEYVEIVSDLRKYKKYAKN